MRCFKNWGFECGNPTWQITDEWIAEGSGDPGYQLLLDTKIVSQVNGKTDLLYDESEEEEEADPMPNITHAKANEAFNIALQLPKAEETNSTHLLLVKNWMSSAVRKRNDS